MTYDTWKTTEPDYTIGWICDGCLEVCGPADMVLRDDGPCYCAKCFEQQGENDEGD